MTWKVSQKGHTTVSPQVYNHIKKMNTAFRKCWES